jgi:hypothetical protein
MRWNKKVNCFFFVISICLIVVFVRLSLSADKDFQPPTAIPSEKTPGKEILEKPRYDPRNIITTDLFVDKIVVTVVDKDTTIRPVRTLGDTKPINVNVTVYVKNNGGSTSTALSPKGHAAGSHGESKAEVYVHHMRSNYLDRREVTVPSLDEGETHTFSFKDTMQKGEIATYLVRADDTKWIAEINEGNNSYQKTFEAPR